MHYAVSHQTAAETIYNRADSKKEHMGLTNWLNQEQLVRLYNSSKSNISEHIKHIFEEGELDELATVRKFRTVASNGAINTSDSDQTFITGTDPNNYIWYSGKLWRAVSIDTTDNSVKLVTQWNISSVVFNASRDNPVFEDSVMEQWLNDTSVDGFLGNLRAPENFIKMDSVWNATMTEEFTKPAETTMVTDAAGLLNAYEYTMSYNGTDYENGYLNNGLWWWTLTPYITQYSTYHVRYIGQRGDANQNLLLPSANIGVRPSVNLKADVKIESGDGTVNNPYRLE